MTQGKKIYETLRTEHKIVVMETGFCTVASDQKKDAMDKGEVSINQQEKGADGTEFEIVF